MAKKPQRKSKKLQSPCPLCGAEIETVWMKDGTVRAVESERRLVIFSNMAQADGREMLVWVPHHNCERGRGK